MQKFEPKLLADYGESYQEWAKKFEAAVQRQLDSQSVEERKATIQKTLSELEAKRQNLWFFENRDDIDIQIYKKKVYYPKRWFGKRRSPRQQTPSMCRRLSRTTASGQPVDPRQLLATNKLDPIVFKL